MQSLRTEVRSTNPTAQHVLSVQGIAKACPALAADGQPGDIPPISASYREAEGRKCFPSLPPRPFTSRHAQPAGEAAGRWWLSRRKGMGLCSCHCPPPPEHSALALLSSPLRGSLVPRHLRTAVVGYWRS